MSSDAKNQTLRAKQAPAEVLITRRFPARSPTTAGQGNSTSWTWSAGRGSPIRLRSLAPEWSAAGHPIHRITPTVKVNRLLLNNVSVVGVRGGISGWSARIPGGTVARPGTRSWPTVGSRCPSADLSTGRRCAAVASLGERRATGRCCYACERDPRPHWAARAVRCRVRVTSDESAARRPS